MKRIKIAIAIMAVVLIASLGIYFLADHLNSNKTKKEITHINKVIKTVSSASFLSRSSPCFYVKAVLSPNHKKRSA